MQRERQLTFIVKGNLSKDEASLANQAHLSIDQDLMKKKDEVGQFYHLLQTNPDAARAQYYISNQRESLASQYSWEYNATKMEKNPATEMQLLRETKKLEADKFDWERQIQQKEYDLKADKNAWEKKYCPAQVGRKA
jgi:hypothetical protein